MSTRSSPSYCQERQNMLALLLFLASERRLISVFQTPIRCKSCYGASPGTSSSLPGLLVQRQPGKGYVGLSLSRLTLKRNQALPAFCLRVTFQNAELVF